MVFAIVSTVIEQIFVPYLLYEYVRKREHLERRDLDLLLECTVTRGMICIGMIMWKI